MNVLSSSAWIRSYQQTASAHFRLFCFPYAGGGASVFRDWGEALPGGIEVCPIQLPGRESRILERPFDEMATLVTALSAAIEPYLDKPFALWGHSMGALICFELAHYLHQENKPKPLHLFVSGRKGPQVPERISLLHQLPEEEFVEKLRQLNGTPETVLQHEELMQLMLPTLRADFSLVETYNYTVRAPLDCAITAFGGLQDETVTVEELQSWREETCRAFTLHLFSGDHFYLRSFREQLLTTLSYELRQLLEQVPG